VIGSGDRPMLARLRELYREHVERDVDARERP